MNKNAITLATYNKVAQKYWEKVSAMNQYDKSYDIFCQLLPQKAKVLELGCGPGNVTQYIMRNRADLHYTAIDLAANMIALARKHNPLAHFLQLDCREIATLNQSYDAIIGAFVLPYLDKAECANLIMDCANILTPKGILYLSTMEGDDAQSGYERTSFSGEDLVHIHYHQEGYLKKCLNENDFGILHLFKQICHEPAGRVYYDMLFIAQKL